MDEKRDNSTSRARLPWEERTRGKKRESMGFMPMSACMVDGSLVHTCVSDFEAFAMIWDPKAAPSIAESAEQRASSDKTRKAGRGFKGSRHPEIDERLLLLNFQEKRGALIALSGSLWSAPEKNMLASHVTRQAWINAWDAGARVVDGMGVERCNPPTSWHFDAVHPRARTDCAKTLLWARRGGFLSQEALGVWVKAIEARGYKDRADGKSSLNDAATLYVVDVEHGEIEAVSAAAQLKSRLAPRL